MTDDLNLLDPVDGYEELLLEVDDETVVIRVAPIQPPASPLGPAHSEPHWGVFGSAVDWDPGWVVLFTTPDPQEKIETLSDADLFTVLRLSILYGASWAAVSESVLLVRSAQEDCAAGQPPLAFDLSLEQLRVFRTSINAADPKIVSILMQLTAHWAGDAGGYRGPRF